MQHCDAFRTQENWYKTIELLSESMVPHERWIRLKITASKAGRGKLSKQEIAAGLYKLDGWSVVNGNLHRMFEFKDFTEAFGFMTRVARAADRMDHHPDWSNTYNKVTVDLSTHSAGGMTKNDFELAGKIQTIHGQSVVAAFQCKPRYVAHI
jgi:4a-hydroxytetrahydrobiopterin dehydratase